MYEGITKKMLFVTPIYYASNASPKEHVDDLLTKSLENFVYQQYDLSYQQADSAYVLAKKIDYSEGIAQAILYKSKVLIEVGLYKDGLRILDEIENEKAYKKHIIL